MNPKFCTSCGFGVGANQKFCSKCGNRLQQSPEKYCERCQAVLNENAKFCTRCGQRTIVEEEAQQSVAENLTEETEKKAIEADKSELSLEMIKILQNPADHENISFYVEEYDKFRKLTEEIDDEISLTIHLNASSSIIKFFDSRPYLIKALQGYDESFIRASKLGRGDLANQIRFILAKLNMKFGDLIPKPSNRVRYYQESYKIIQELIREVKEGDIIGKDTVMVYMLYTEILERQGQLKQAVVSINAALRLAEENQTFEDDCKLLKVEILAATARYKEAFELLSIIDSDKLENPVKKDVVIADIHYLLGDYEIAEPLIEQLVENSKLSTEDRIKLKKSLTNIMLRKNPDRSMEVFQTIYTEELDPAQEVRTKAIEESLKHQINRTKISHSIKLADAEQDFRERLDGMRIAQGREQWEEAINNGRRLIEILYDYGKEIDPNNEKEAEINFRLGDALFHNQEFGQSFSYYEKSVSLYETGIGEKSQYPTAIKKLVENLIKLRQYKEAYEQAVKGKQLAEAISHPGLIGEFDKVITQFDPERLERLQAFNLFMMNSMATMADRGSFQTLYRLLGIGIQSVDFDVDRFIPLAMDVFRMPIQLPLALLTNQSISIGIQKIININNFRPLWLNPAGVFQEVPKFHAFIPYLENLGRPVDQRLVMLGVTAGLTFIVLNNSKYRITQPSDLPVAITKKLQDGVTEGELIMMIIAALIRAVELVVVL